MSKEKTIADMEKLFEEATPEQRQELWAIVALNSMHLVKDPSMRWELSIGLYDIIETFGQISILSKQKDPISQALVLLLRAEITVRQKKLIPILEVVASDII